MKRRRDRHHFFRLGLTLLVLMAALFSLSGMQQCTRSSHAAHLLGDHATDGSEDHTALLDQPRTNAFSGDVASVAPPSARHQMRATWWVITSEGLRLENTRVIHGRVKAPPRSQSPHRLEFDVFDAVGAKIYTGSMDHPLYAHSESLAEGTSGELQRHVNQLVEDKFLLRLPADLNGTRIKFYEFSATDPAEPRRTIGTFDLM